jgi:hypothetical protein
MHSMMIPFVLLRLTQFLWTQKNMCVFHQIWSHQSGLSTLGIKGSILGKSWSRHLQTSVSYDPMTIPLTSPLQISRIAVVYYTETDLGLHSLIVNRVIGQFHLILYIFLCFSFTFHSTLSTFHYSIVLLCSTLFYWVSSLSYHIYWFILWLHSIFIGFIWFSLHIFSFYFLSLFHLPH